MTETASDPDRGRRRQDVESRARDLRRCVLRPRRRHGRRGAVRPAAARRLTGSRTDAYPFGLPSLGDGGERVHAYVRAQRHHGRSAGGTSSTPKARSSAGWPPRRRSCCRASTGRSTSRSSTPATTSSSSTPRKVKLTGRKDRPEALSAPTAGTRAACAKSARRTSARRSPGASGRRSRARHAPEDEAGRRHVPQAQGLRGRRAPARRPETHRNRGRVTWQSFSTTARAGARRRRPACSCAPARASSPSTTSPYDQHVPDAKRCGP